MMNSNLPRTPQLESKSRSRRTMLPSPAPAFVMVILALCFGGTLAGEAPIRVLTLQESVQLALQQNPDVLLARLDHRSANANADSTADPFSLKLSVGSGLAYSSGFPMNVGGSGPSLVNAQASMTLFDRPQRYRLQEARVRADAVSMGTANQERIVVMEVARLHLDAESKRKAAESMQREVDSLARIAAIRQSEESEGRSLPLDAKLARAEVARARHHLRETQSALAQTQETLACVLGLPENAQVSPAGELRPPAEVPLTLEDATGLAIADHPELHRLERQMAAAKLSSQAAKATHWPIVRLVSQYSMFSRFNNYDSFYNRFERHNGQIGASFELPLLTGKAPRAAAEQADVETERLRLEAATARRRVALDTSRSFRDREDAYAYHELAVLELDAARERVSVTLARSAAGRATLAELESARVDEARRWAEFYRSRAAAERADLELLSQTGQVLAHLRK